MGSTIILCKPGLTYCGLNSFEGLQPHAAIIVATVRALKMHGGGPKVSCVSQVIFNIRRCLTFRRELS